MTSAPQLYLLTPADFAPEALAESLARVLDAAPVACLRLDLASQDEGRLSAAARAVLALARPRSLPVTITAHTALAGQLGLDGVHLSGDARAVHAARRALGADAIVGAHAGASCHAGLVAGEAGADYVTFGPVRAGLGSGEVAGDDLFSWWQQMVTIPVIAEGAVGPEDAARLAPHVDFIALGEEIWAAPDPAAQLVRYHAAVAGQGAE